MHRLAASLASLVVFIAVPALADPAAKPADAAKPAPFGKAMDSLKCTKWIGKMSANKCASFTEANLDEPCKTEFHARMEECKKRPADAQYLDAQCHREGWDFPDAKDVDKYCLVGNWRQIVAQAKIASITYPKADVHDKAIESGIRTSYAHEWPDDKIVDVVITSRDYDPETDAFSQVIGRDVTASIVSRQKDGSCLVHSEMWLQKGNGRKFSGPFEPRGAGSQSRDEINCDLLPKGK
jgi:hypothetical protein